MLRKLTRYQGLFLMAWINDFIDRLTIMTNRFLFLRNYLLITYCILYVCKESKNTWSNTILYSLMLYELTGTCPYYLYFHKSPYIACLYFVPYLFNLKNNYIVYIDLLIYCCQMLYAFLTCNTYSLNCLQIYSYRISVLTTHHCYTCIMKWIFNVLHFQRMIPVQYLY